MQGYVRIVIAGNVTRDVEMREANGTKLAKFALAVNEKRKGEESVTFFDCTAFNKTAEIVERYVKKGNPLLVDGQMRSRRYEKDGQQRTAWDVAVDRVTLLGGGKSEQREGATAADDDFFN